MQQQDYKEAIADYDKILFSQEFSSVAVLAEINPQTKLATVSKVIENSPAEKGGMKISDQILVNNSELSTLP